LKSEKRTEGRRISGLDLDGGMDRLVVVARNFFLVENEAGLCRLIFGNFEGRLDGRLLCRSEIWPC
jgi:hypothetical protein